MKKIITILCCTFILFTQSKGQIDTITGDYIVLYSGKIINADEVTYKNSYFHAGTARYHEDQVSLYRIGDSSFANSKHMAINKKKGRTKFFKAESVGKVNIYIYRYRSTIERSRPYGRKGTYGMNEDIDVSKDFIYYNKGIEPLKKANYKNFKKDLGDNPNCTKALRQFRIAKAAPIVLWPLAFGSYALAVMVAIRAPSDKFYLNYLPFVVPITLNILAKTADRELIQKKAIKVIEKYNE